MNSLFTKEKQEWIEEAREAMVYLLQTGSSYVTSDDIHRMCPLPRYLHKNTMGSVFNSRDFRSVGYTKSRRPSANGRVIQQWVLR